MTVVVRACLCVVVAVVAAAQEPDLEFRFSIGDPAYARDSGPRVCFDEAHNNQYTAGGLLQPFAILLSDDGYRITRWREAFDRQRLQACDVLVIATAVAGQNADIANWEYPHDSAFTSQEISELALWIRDGGSVLLVTDHAPYAGAAAGLAAVLGFTVMDGWAYARTGERLPDMFTREQGTLHAHAITEGRGAQERITALATFVAHAFYGADDVAPLLSYGGNAVSRTRLGEMGQKLAGVAPEENPRYRIAGWLHGGARKWKKGRIVMLGDVAVCSARKSDQPQMRFGMNHPQAKQNAQFCLNVVRWLSRVLEPEGEGRAGPALTLSFPPLLMGQRLYSGFDHALQDFQRGGVRH